MSYVIHYLEIIPPCTSDQPSTLEPRFIAFQENNVSPVLEQVAQLRKRKNVCHITTSSELEDMVGNLGVDSVSDGKLPDGSDYDWSKAGRAGKMRPSDYTKTIIKKD